MSIISDSIRSVPDFPKPGINFKDITTLLKDSKAFTAAVEELYRIYKNKQIDKIACIESRGFILGSPLAIKLGAGFIPIRKKGKLPAETVREEYALEYGTDSIEIHKDAIVSGERILLHDDLLATGGTMQAAVRIVQKLGGKIVGISFLIELEFLKGREKLIPFDVQSIIKYKSEQQK
ncbi:MAG: adenine phosphoribosyltransferase [Bacteroidota bacterium]